LLLLPNCSPIEGVQRTSKCIKGKDSGGVIQVDPGIKAIDYICSNEESAFKNFKDECIEQLSTLQKEFIKLDMNSYEPWF
jgi:hypothetical protein